MQTLSVQTLTWADLEPRYQALERETLTPENVLDWLHHWSNLACEVQEVATWRMRAYHENTADSAAEAAHNALLQDVVPHVTETEHRLTQKMLALEGYTPPAQHQQMWKRFAQDAALYRDANVPLETEISVLCAEYEKLKASKQVVIGDETLSVPMAQKRLLEPSRDVRKAAWYGLNDYENGLAPEGGALFEKLLELRQQQAHNADFPNFLEYTWQTMSRFDYTPEQARELHESVRLEVVPLLRKVRQQKQCSLGLERLRPWDVQADAQGGEALKPFSNITELEDGLERIFDALDPELGGHFTTLRKQGNLELETRAGKIPNLGYNTFFAQSQQSYIYWNATGTNLDIRVLLHEAGHAFNFLSSMKTGVLLWEICPPLEFCEVASQAMELLTLPLLERPIGFYSPEDTAKARAEELETVLRVIVNVAKDDSFQHWLYTQPQVSLTDLDTKWLEVSQAYEAGMDWSGLEEKRAKGWQSGHIFTSPLYMLEYAFAWLGALQIWRNALENPQKTLEQYKYALTLGNTKPLPELFEAAGIQFAFDRNTVRELMEFVAAQLELN